MNGTTKRRGLGILALAVAGTLALAYAAAYTALLLLLSWLVFRRKVM